MNRKRTTIVLRLSSPVELLRRTSPVARQAFRRGNASGIHGGAKPRYGTRERQAARSEERDANFGRRHE